MNYQDDITERIRLTIIEAIQSKASQEPENYMPQFIEALTNRLSELVLDEISFKLRR